MKNLFRLLVFFSLGIFGGSCDDQSDDGNPNKLTGSQSKMGVVGVSVSSSSAEIAGVSNFSAVVESLENGISTYTAQATVTNPLLIPLILLASPIDDST